MFKIWNSSKHFFPILPSFQIIRSLNREHLSRQTPSANHLHWSLVIPLLPLPQVLPFRQCYSVFFPCESFFGFFSIFFHADGNVAFTHTFLQLFTSSPKFSRTLFRTFSTVGFFFSREGNKQFSEIYTDGFFFSRVQKLITFTRVFFIFRICRILDE